MRFCMVTTFYPPFHRGGDAIYVRALARGLRRRGHEVEVISCRDAYRVAGDVPSRSPDDDDRDIVVHRLQHPLGRLSPLITQQTGRPGLKAGLLGQLLERDFDVIHFHNISLVGGPGVLALGRAAVKLYTLHDHWLLCATHSFWKNRERECDRPTCWSCCLRSGIPPQLWRLGTLIKRELEHVDLLFSPSEFTARKHREAGITRPIEILPLFSRLEPDRRPSRAMPERPRFLFVGRVIEAKGIRSLVELFAQLPDCDLYVAGEGDLRAPLETAFAGAANIRFVGQVALTDLSALYGSATATIIPSLAPETFGLVAVESLAHSTPVVCREAGGCGELVRATGGGIVCNNTVDLQAAVARLARDSDLAQRLGQSGRKAYEEKYSEKRHLAAYLDRVHALRSAAASCGGA